MTDLDGHLCNVQTYDSSIKHPLKIVSYKPGSVLEKLAPHVCLLALLSLMNSFNQPLNA